MTTAIKDILDERGARYGKFADLAEVAVGLKNVLRRGLGVSDRALADDQAEALNMICSKLARIVNGDPHYADSWRDIAGYATLVADRLEGRER